ncbi:DALR anticodon-binding domain-containing protein 3 isoform X2 [Tribolium castaneum]|uniref:DALR anticodon-binding domain-containing protein 3 isoform X2 n=1 Tax=Tribolium castaneum TaxID=7070 RepID=UPI00046C2E72|nr:PREDICTED: DALR anticodon-binding domain-containing protein 3 isoform X2 [Tribolium castaneum]|eukprot:XP_008201296.1 PREDICTED: DALR anticodon-binding domain-containing protein 3 isoform X2 [Tribolium castaneum]
MYPIITFIEDLHEFLTGDRKRALDLQLMAQHKYGVQVKPSWGDYFDKLGKASVVIEMLQNRLHKTIKITLNNLQATNKGPSFIFYNCARLSSLLKQFDERVANKLYPELPLLEKIDFTLLNQPEEWEIVYVYILQFPTVVISTVCDIKSGLINLHNLIIFLSNLSSIFSVYYRRVKILISAKEHLLPTLFARIYLLKAVQQVFHTALKLLNIEPVKEM